MFFEQGVSCFAIEVKKSNEVSGYLKYEKKHTEWQGATWTGKHVICNFDSDMSIGNTQHLVSVLRRDGFEHIKRHFLSV